ncbi:MAG TPA: STM3941 family protein [Mucilaginibacter sp.]|jgi:hypothetical protein|nr:STM3941 family protein [Mucilaginibacter sp.]
MADVTERETFPFSPLIQLTCLGFLSLFYLFVKAKVDAFIAEDPFYFFLSLSVLVLICWTYIRALGFALIRRPAIILTNECLTNTIEGYSIKWTDVRNVYMTSEDVGGYKDMIPLQGYSITIKVEDNEKYFAQVKNPFTRWFRRVTRNWPSDRLIIDLSLVRGDEDEILHRVLRYYQNNRGF